MAGCALAPSVGVLAASVLLIGVAGAVFGLARQAYLTEAVPVAMRARALSTLGGVNRIGLFVGPFVGAVVVARWGISAAYVVGMLASAAAFVLLLLVRDITAGERVAQRATPRRPVGAVLREQRGTLATLGVGAMFIAAARSCRTALVPLWAEAIGLDTARLRLAAFAVSIGGGCALGFAAFASYANRLPVCDALSPVWLSDALVAGALMLGLAMLGVERWKMRLSLALGAGVIIAAFHALMWPHCLTRLEGVSPEVAQLWLSHVREARPVWSNGWQVACLILALPVAGLLGYPLLAWTVRHDRERLRTLLSVAAPSLAATLLLAWQTRTGPAAQMLAIPGAIALPWLLAPRVFASSSSVLRVVGTSVVVLLGLGGLVPTVLNFVPGKPTTPREGAIGRANGLCPTLWAMRPVALLPKGIVFTFVDLAPRLITVTHHSSIAGPYHRNGDAIADTMHAFRGTADDAHAIILRHHANYVLTCPAMSQTTIFMAEAPKGFYGQLERGQVPHWLQPIPLPKGNPLKIYRVVG